MLRLLPHAQHRRFLLRRQWSERHDETETQALRLINNLLADIREPDFIWQVVALVACLGWRCSSPAGGAAGRKVGQA